MKSEDLSNEDLSAYIDGEAQPAVAALIEGQPEYIARAQKLAQAQQYLSENLTALPKPSALMLGEYELGLLPPDDAQMVERSLRQHPHAVRQQEILQEFLEDVALPVTLAPPGPMQQLSILIATFVQAADASMQPLATGIRGGKEGVYQAGDYQIVVEIDTDLETPSRRVLTGLVQGPTLSSLRAELLAVAPVSVVRADLDEFGNFMLMDLFPGTYHLVIRCTEPPLEIHVQSLDIE